ncbi:GDP-D-mannose dehydratase [Halobacterium salinarum NRC-1]|uniref:GDP-D-mannose dehydratase n=3 Tax=Halobacterium salinarum TaxID=2242 RepID=Q9HSU9_HALSA|nr:SDR family oxidoreductase [Halobacterium salinarum]AAG18703.1 GDP-D-mannose dehydratase [Halobacterium salinarum NRC-1]MBB6091087.1 nucleoside-diphosphate-sugar epimerase [Halobacterium salinarum]UEB92119.1 SDR family oxidoreductase [Halobacterium salinarum NRC-34001]CAP12950.1 GalE family epimerase/dehydratase [Halobacterium salinarum R1]DAC77390.1 TPA_inf: GalE family epimerase/dehydratase [Halobacterium salinarum NRC-1]
MPTALVTGVAGFIGSHLAAALLDRGYDVRGVDNFATGHDQNLEPLRGTGDFSFYEADIRDADLVADVTNGVDYVFHQAADSSVPRSVEDPVTTTDVNCTGTATVIDAAREADVDTVVVASSAAIYGSTETFPKVESMTEQPESPYALSKHYTEKLALQASELYDIDTAALRYFNIYGPRQDPNGDYAAVIPKFISLMLDGERPVIYGDGEQSRDFTFIDNAIQANIRAAEGDVTGEAFNVGCGGRVTVNELVDVLNDLLDTDIDPIYDDPRPGDVRHSHADISKARELLSYEPEVGFSEGLEQTIPYYR